MNSKHVREFSDNSSNGNWSILEETVVNVIVAYLSRYRSVSKLSDVL
jgi:hypothetical protein